MKIIKPNYEILFPMSPDQMWLSMERFGRISHLSDNKCTGKPEDARDFVLKWAVRNNPKHSTILEAVDITVEFIHNIAIGREALRHRVMSPMQESTRYCNYAHEKFGEDMQFIAPLINPDTDPEAFMVWKHTMEICELAYMSLIEFKIKPEIARDVLPLATKTKFAIHGNFNFWRDFMWKRTFKAAHPQMRETMIRLCFDLETSLPGMFTDILTANVPEDDPLRLTLFSEETDKRPLSL